jgi:hypothetical protein
MYVKRLFRILFIEWATTFGIQCIDLLDSMF